jgi:hypothetical protein
MLILLMIILSVNISEATGSASSLFLTYPVDARASGMGEAFTAVCNDVSGIYWNPGGLTTIKNSQIMVTHLEGPLRIKYNFLGYAQRVKNLGILTCGIVALYDTQERTVENNESGIYIGKRGKFSNQNLAGIFSFGKEIFPTFSVGSSAKFITQRYEQAKVSSWAIDLGMMKYDLLIKNLNFGFVVQNIGPRIKLISEKFPLPLRIRCGLSYKVANQSHKGILAIEVNKPLEANFKYHLGGEYWYKDMLGVRGGYKIGYELFNLSMGIGIVYKSWQLDYAVIPAGEFGITHKISLLWRLMKKEGGK